MGQILRGHYYKETCGICGSYVEIDYALSRTITSLVENWRHDHVCVPAKSSVDAVKVMADDEWLELIGVNGRHAKG